MIRFRKPELIPTLVIGFMVLLMFSLSAWQIKRLNWKTDIISQIETAQALPPENMLAIPTEKLGDYEWRNVQLKGRFLYDKELHAMPRYLNEQLGYGILTPLKIQSPKGTEYVLVNRGWVPPAKKEFTSRAQGNPKGIVTITGVIRNPQPQGMFRPNNEPAKNIWFWNDISAMRTATDLPLLPVILDATNEVKDGPKPFPIAINIRNDHLGYAIIWFLLGVIGIVMFGIYYREK